MIKNYQKEIAPQKISLLCSKNSFFSNKSRAIFLSDLKGEINETNVINPASVINFDTSATLSAVEEATVPF